MAKPKHIFTDNEKSLIIALYTLGHTDQAVADALRFPVRGFEKMLDYNTHKGKDGTEEPLSSLIKRVRGTATTQVEGSLFSQAMRGNLTAIIFYLCNRAPERWVNVNKAEQTVNVNTTINEAQVIEEAKKRGMEIPDVLLKRNQINISAVVPGNGGNGNGNGKH